MNQFNKSLPAEFARRARNLAAKAGTAVVGLGYAGLALAQDPTPADQVVTAVTAGGVDGKKIAVAVVLALWGIWTIYLLRRKG